MLFQFNTEVKLALAESRGLNPNVVIFLQLTSSFVSFSSV